MYKAANLRDVTIIQLDKKHEPEKGSKETA
jgi:hypothetical protein